MLNRWRDSERRTRPVDPETRAALDARWQELPAHVRTPAQMLGRKFTGCEAKRRLRLRLPARGAVRPDGTPRFDVLSFAVHIDGTMRGRRGAKRPDSEAQLHDARRRVRAMFDRLEHEHGVRAQLAHNMMLLHPPDRTPNGYRDYAIEVVDRVAFILHAQAAGLTLHQIRAVLAVRDEGHAPCVHVGELVADRLADVDQRLQELRETRGQLRRLQQRLAALDPAHCQPTSICSAITPAGV